MNCFICITCGTRYPPSKSPPLSCPICEDDRQYVRQDGQEWTTLAEMQESFNNQMTDIEPGLVGLRTQPGFAIGQEARLIQTPAGNLLWESTSFIDDASIEEVKRRGGIAAIAISHPHFYSSMVDWSRAFDDAPIYIHRKNEPWVMRPDDAIHYWDDDQFQALPGVNLVRCGGHFPGSAVAHWAAGAEGQGVLLTGDTIYVVSDRQWVSFMYSYPNLIPLNAPAVREIMKAIEPLNFDRLYAAWPDRVVTNGAKDAVLRSGERYIEHIAD